MSAGSSITSGCREERIAAEIASTSPDYTDRRLLEAQWPGVDIIVGASVARRRVNLPESIVKIRFWLPGRFVVAGFRQVSKNGVPYRGTEGSNPSPSSAESRANRVDLAHDRPARAIGWTTEESTPLERNAPSGTSEIRRKTLAQQRGSCGLVMIAPLAPMRAILATSRRKPATSRGTPLSRDRHPAVD